MKSIFFGLGAATALLCLPVSSGFAAERECLPIGGVALGQFYSGGKEALAHTAGTWASTRGSVKNQKETSTGLRLEMEHAFTTADGALISSRDDVELTKIPGKKDTYLLEVAYTVNESYGRLKGYGGTFHSRGAIDLATGEALLRYSGKLCK